MTNQRKHVSQMTLAEQQAVSSFVHSVPAWGGLDDNPHLIERKQAKRISDSEILETLAKGEVIEAHANNYPSIRIVVRHTINGRDVCVCASKQGRIITVWTNDTKDVHKTLDKSQYQWYANLVSLFGTSNAGGSHATTIL